MEPASANSPTSGVDGRWRGASLRELAHQRRGRAVAWSADPRHCTSARNWGLIVRRGACDDRAALHTGAIVESRSTGTRRRSPPDLAAPRRPAVACAVRRRSAPPRPRRRARRRLVPASAGVVVPLLGASSSMTAPSPALGNLLVPPAVAADAAANFVIGRRTRRYAARFLTGLQVTAGATGLLPAGPLRPVETCAAASPAATSRGPGSAGSGSPPGSRRACSPSSSRTRRAGQRTS